MPPFFFALHCQSILWSLLSYITNFSNRTVLNHWYSCYNLHGTCTITSEIVVASQIGNSCCPDFFEIFLIWSSTYLSLGVVELDQMVFETGVPCGKVHWMVWGTWPNSTCSQRCTPLKSELSKTCGPTVPKHVYFPLKLYFRPLPRIEEIWFETWFMTDPHESAFKWYMGNAPPLGSFGDSNWQMFVNFGLFIH